MDSKFYVSYEVEMLLKEKGCNLHKNIPIYNERGDVIGCDPADRLTKAEAIDWLESKGMCIVVFKRTIDNKVEWRYVIHGHTEIISGFKTRLEAEDSAIIKACELL